MTPKPTWTVAMGDAFNFEIVHVAPRRYKGEFGTDADLNGEFSTKLAAVESVIAGFEETRVALNRQIALAKRMRSRLRASMEGTGV